jgi:hypothetical protein
VCSQKLQPEGVIRSSSKVVSRIVADEALVVPIRSGVGDLDSIYTFNDSGTQLWTMIESGRSAEALVQHLQKTFGITPDQAKADVERFLGELAEERLIEKA